MTCTSVCEFRPLLCFCSQHMSRSKNFFFLRLLFRCDIVTTTQRNETSWRSQRGGSVMASNNSSAASAQVAVAIALQCVNTKEASNANCANERCPIL